ncbi:MAG TPA: hypothetical protein VEG62_09510 [Acidimicrobiales bacterium]|nr:hypothetical protein [Acidimicrobiales bacterium]
MGVFLERLLLELAAIAVQIAMVKLIAWLRQRTQDADPAERTVHLAAA